MIGQIISHDGVIEKWVVAARESCTRPKTLNSGASSLSNSFRKMWPMTLMHSFCYMGPQPTQNQVRHRAGAEVRGEAELRSAWTGEAPVPTRAFLSTASGHLHRPQDCSRFVFRLFELALRVGVCDDARARLQVGFLALH
jgi:hypothetical protein